MTGDHPALVLPQPGVLALGTANQAYLEFDLAEPDGDPCPVLDAVGEICNGLVTGQGCNVVAGFRPELWARMVPTAAPDDVHGFTEPVVAADGYTMPATQHDLVIWIAASHRDQVFDESRRALRVLDGLAGLSQETIGWTYHDHLDLTGFIDGTENPPLGEADEVCLIAAGPAAGGSVLLLQRWHHDSAAWEALDVATQEAVIGRTKADSVELADKAEDAHAARTDQEDVGKILRRNLPYGGVADHGTMFVGLCAQQRVLHEMLERMAGLDGGPRDAITRYTDAQTGAYYYLPPVNQLPVPPDDD